MPQAKFPIFSASIGERIRWIRKQRGVSLMELGEGKASTAGSWEEGKHPRQPSWHGIADRLGVSWPFISNGIPSSKADYDFLREQRNAVDFEGAPAAVADIMLAGSRPSEAGLTRDAAGARREEIRQLLEATISGAGDDLDRLGWIKEQLRANLRPPAHWHEAGALGADHAKALKGALKDIESEDRSRREPHQSSPIKTQEGAGR